MKKIITIAIVALLGLSSCKKEIQIEPEPTKIDTVMREFKVVSLNKTRTWSVYLNNQLVNSTNIDTLNSTYVSTKFYFHKNDSIKFYDNGLIDNKLYIFNPNVLITHKQCNSCTMYYKFKMN